ncbi:hypothetical protein ACS0TY_033425 [Phlomoides rotata]
MLKVITQKGIASDTHVAPSSRVPFIKYFMRFFRMNLKIWVVIFRWNLCFHF